MNLSSFTSFPLAFHQTGLGENKTDRESGSSLHQGQTRAIEGGCFQSRLPKWTRSCPPRPPHRWGPTGDHHWAPNCKWSQRHGPISRLYFHRRRPPLPPSEEEGSHRRRCRKLRWLENKGITYSVARCDLSYLPPPTNQLKAPSIPSFTFLLRNHPNFYNTHPAPRRLPRLVSSTTTWILPG